MFKTILIPTDGSALSQNAAKQALQLAKSINARVVGFHCEEPYHVLSVVVEMISDTPRSRASRACASLRSRRSG